MKTLRSINEAIFGYVSPVTMGVVRMVTGFLALVNFLMISIDFEAWFTEKGFTPAWHAERWGDKIWRINLLAGQTDSRVTAALYVLLCVSCLLTMLGLWTRISSIAMFVLIVTFHHRNPMILHSGDTLLRLMSFYVMIAPSGVACSLDRLIKLWKGKAPIDLELVSAWPQRLMQFQVTVVYFTTVWHKWTGTHWRDGTATWFVPQLHEFDRFPAPAFMDRQPFVAVTTYSTLLIELAVAFLAYAKPLRKWALLGGVALHAGIEYRFNIPMFSFIMVSTYLAFYEGAEVSSWAKRTGQQWKRLLLQVTLPAGRDFDPQRGAVVKAVDAFSLIDYRQGAEPGWKARTALDEERQVTLATLLRSPGAWPLLLTPTLWKRILEGSLTAQSAPQHHPARAEAVELK
ncbi:MAG: HTTM domain-containing protein [Armatimonadetes bacterium]|nr:HTTM domain-containing protein [Armatimonadota bacterium]